MSTSEYTVAQIKQGTGFDKNCRFEDVTSGHIYTVRQIKDGTGFGPAARFRAVV